MQPHKRAYTVQRMTISQRMKAARKHAGLTQKQLAEIAGVSQPVISQLEGGSSLKSVHITKLATACGVSPLWLAEGVGAMTDPSATASKDSEPSNISMSVQPSKYFTYPVISWVAAGAWAEAVEPWPPGFADRYELSDYDSKGPAFWLDVKGDSMTSPVGVSIPEGMMILVDTEADVRSGKLVIAKLANSNEATFKKFVEDGGRHFLKPLNPAYPMSACAEDCRIIGVVVRAMMKL